MIPILYDSNESAFTSNGLCRLRDIISCTVTEERNNIYECEFQYPVSGANYDLIKCGRIIAVIHDDTDDIQPFDIVSYSRPIDGVVTFRAVHISYRQSKMTVSGTNINSLSGAFQMLKNAQPSNPFNYWTNKTSTGLFAAADGVPRSVRQMLGGSEGSILDCYGGEYEWDKWTVKLWGSRGQKLDLTIRYGLNLMSYDEDVDFSETFTACIPYWVGGDDNAVVKGNKVSTGVVSYDGRESVVPLNLTDKFEEKPTATQLENLAAQLMDSNRVFAGNQSIKVEFARLQDSPEYASYAELMKCSLCDSINVVFPAYDTSAYFKIVKTVYDVLEERFTEMELGALSTTLSQALGLGNNNVSVSDMKIVQSAADAQNSANLANGILAGMQSAAQQAGTTLNGIYATAEEASDTLADMKEAAEAAHTTLEGVYQDAEDAKTAASSASTAAASAQASATQAISDAATAKSSADSAQASANQALANAATAQQAANNAQRDANTANKAANGALDQLSVVEDVVGVLNWVSTHGTYAATTDTEVVPGKYYFTRSGSAPNYTYSVVVNPTGNPSTQGYYELTGTDEAVANYVSSHLALTNAGLWVINDNNSCKILLASDGMKVYDAQGNLVATFGESISFSDGLQELANFSESGIVVGDFFDVTNGGGEISHTEYTKKGVREVGAVTIDLSTDATFSTTWESISSGGAFVIRIGYVFKSGLATFTTTREVSFVKGTSSTETYATYNGANSVTVTASHPASTATYQYKNSISLGVVETSATPLYRFGHNVAEEGGAYGFLTGHGTKAAGDYQIVGGEFNAETSNAYLVIGKGTSDTNRSNAFVVGKDGGLYCQGHTERIGFRQVSSRPSAITVQPNESTDVWSITLSPGTYVIQGQVQFSEGSSGLRIVAISPNSADTSLATINEYAGERITASSFNSIVMNVTLIAEAYGTSTYYLSVYHSNSSAIDVTRASLKKVRIA